MSKITGRFKTINNDDIEVAIYNKTITLPNINIDSTKTVYFGDNPVIIAQQNDDTFDHILKTTCKITLVTNRYLGEYLFANNWLDIIVNVWRNNECIFCGAVTPMTFQQNYSKIYEELEINCVDILSTLKERRLTDNVAYSDLVAQSTIRPFNWFMTQMKLGDTANVIPNLPDIDYQEAEMAVWVETSWTRQVDDYGNITYYGIESEVMVLDDDVALATGNERQGEQKQVTWIQSTDSVIISGIPYFKEYAHIVVGGNDVNTGDWRAHSETGDLPEFVSNVVEVTGWQRGEGQFEYYENITTYDLYSNGMKVSVSESVGEQIPESPNETSNGSFYEFIQGDNSDVDIDEETGYQYYKNYCWITINDESENTGDWVRGNLLPTVVNTRTEVTSWTRTVALQYYEIVTTYDIYSDSTEEVSGTSTGAQIPLTPSSTAFGSYYEMRQGDISDFTVYNNKRYYKNYSYVYFDGSFYATNDWERGSMIVDTTLGDITGTYTNSQLPTLTVTVDGNTTTITPTTSNGQFQYNDVPKALTSFSFELGNWPSSSPRHNITSAYFNNLDMAQVSDMEGALESFSYATYLDVSYFNTSNVTKMSNMFEGNKSLTTLNVSNFNTSNVAYMQNMFMNCESLTSLDLSNFDTSNVEYMISMFYDCTNLTYVNLSSFNTSNVKSMAQMFMNCESLTSLDLRNFDTSNVFDDGLEYNTGYYINVPGMSAMFFYCSSLTSLDISNFDTSKIYNMDSMFNHCSSLTSLNVSSFDTSYVESMNSMFRDCHSLTSLNVSSFDTSNVRNMDEMFSNCYSLTSLDVSNFDTSYLKTTTSMFYGCSSLTTLDISNFATNSSIINCNYMFYGCTNLQSLNMSNFNVDYDVSQIFTGCDNLGILILNNVSDVTFSYLATPYSGLTKRCTVYRDNDIYKYDSETNKWIKQ